MAQKLVSVGKLEMDSWVHVEVVSMFLKACYVLVVTGLVSFSLYLHFKSDAQGIAIFMMCLTVVWHAVAGEYIIRHMLPHGIYNDKRRILDRAGYFEIDPVDVSTKENNSLYLLVLGS